MSAAILIKARGQSSDVGALQMEKYLLCGELSASGSFKEEENSASSEVEASVRVRVYKGRRRGTVDFCGIWKHNKLMKELVANGVGN